MITLHVAETALRMEPERRRVAVAALLDELVTIGRPAAAPVAAVVLTSVALPPR